MIIPGLLIISLLISTQDSTTVCTYSWLSGNPKNENIAGRFAVPDGFVRQSEIAGSFEDWLRHLPLKDGNPPVHLFDGNLSLNQNAHIAVIDIDTGRENLQQCADAVIRLRAEYLYSIGKNNDICFNFTSGDKALFRKWIDGYRPIVLGNKVSWRHSAKTDSSYIVFRNYLDTVFRYAGTFSLKKELVKVDDPTRMKIGDVFIQGGFPGHAVIIVDIAYDKSKNEKLFMLAQSFMPAQEIHILRNPIDSNISPWYRIEADKALITPQWTFEFSDLMRFK